MDQECSVRVIGKSSVLSHHVSLTVNAVCVICEKLSTERKKPPFSRLVQNFVVNCQHVSFESSSVFVTKTSLDFQFCLLQVQRKIVLVLEQMKVGDNFLEHQPATTI